MTTNSAHLQSKRGRRIAAIAVVAATLCAAFFGLRTYGSFMLLMGLGRLGTGEIESSK